VMRNKLLVRVTIPHQDHPQPRPAQPTPSPRPDPAVAHRGGHPDARRRACSLMGLDRCGVDGLLEARRAGLDSAGVAVALADRVIRHALSEIPTDYRPVSLAAIWPTMATAAGSVWL
jgi:hypothetical protein